VRLGVRRRTPLPEREGRWVLTLEGVFRTGERDDRVLIECHNRSAPVTGALVQALADAAAESREADEGMMLATSGYEADAVSLADELGIALLALVDGARAWRAGGWGVAAQPPSWFPEVAAQVVGLSAAGEVRFDLVVADRPAAVLGKLRPQAPRAPEPPRPSPG
jgi:hypothetical protein